MFATQLFCFRTVEGQPEHEALAVGSGVLDSSPSAPCGESGRPLNILGLSVSSYKVRQLVQKLSNFPHGIKINGILVFSASIPSLTIVFELLIYSNDSTVDAKLKSILAGKSFSRLIFQMIKG